MYWSLWVWNSWHYPHQSHCHAHQVYTQSHGLWSMTAQCWTSTFLPCVTQETLNVIIYQCLITDLLSDLPPHKNILMRTTHPIRQARAETKQPLQLYQTYNKGKGWKLVICSTICLFFFAFYMMRKLPVITLLSPKFQVFNISLMFSVMSLPCLHICTLLWRNIWQSPH